MNLFSADPAERLRAARNAGFLARRSVAAKARSWPEWSVGAVNAWVLFVTSKPPTWRDPLVDWEDAPPTLGDPHPGFFYPDTLGFWIEVRRWSVHVLRARQPHWHQPECLSMTAVIHLDGDATRVRRVAEVCQPRTILFLDESAFEESAVTVHRRQAHYVDDPHRPDSVYEGFWGFADDGTVIGKAPQHPSTHRFYRADDMAGFLGAAPAAQDPSSTDARTSAVVVKSPFST